ncbi:hypothetical protein ColTof4_02976 [Colletotrichum tofieldiae]|nr:hypothetical protein ColTof3_13619 [Colletotrichum tofieldiae]GKT70553.1 hypothetical protein ColTof4_02976 [Colletotrichum tofieldiae]
MSNLGGHVQPETPPITSAPADTALHVSSRDTTFAPRGPGILQHAAAPGDDDSGCGILEHPRSDLPTETKVAFCSAVRFRDSRDHHR